MSSVPMPSSFPTPSTTMPLMANTFQHVTGPIHDSPTRHQILDWKPDKWTNLRQTLMQKAHFFHERSGAKVCLHIEHKNKFFVYSSEQRPSKAFEDTVDGLHKGTPTTPLDNLSYPPLMDHIRKTIPKPDIWYSTDVADIPYKRQFIEKPEIPTECISWLQPGQPANGAQAVQPVNTAWSGDLGRPVHGAQLVSAPWPLHSAHHGHMDQPGDAVLPVHPAWLNQPSLPFQHNIRQAVTGPAQAFLPHGSTAVSERLGTAFESDPFNNSDDHDLNNFKMDGMECEDDGRSSPSEFFWSNAASTCSSKNKSNEALARVPEADSKDHLPAHSANAGDPPMAPPCHASAPEATVMEINRGPAPHLPWDNRLGPIRDSPERTAYPSPPRTNAKSLHRQHHEPRKHQVALAIRTFQGNPQGSRLTQSPGGPGTHSPQGLFADGNGSQTPVPAKAAMEGQVIRHPPSPTKVRPAPWTPSPPAQQPTTDPSPRTLSRMRFEIPTQRVKQRRSARIAKHTQGQGRRGLRP